MTPKHKALFAGTFDPITLGHADIARRAARLFDTLVIAVAESPRKGTLFTLDERVALARAAVADVGNIEVVGFSGLLASFAGAQGASVLVRGVRTVADYEYEMGMVGVNRTLNPALDVVFLTPDAKHAFVSSTHVREVTLHGGDASPFVAPHVWAALQAKKR
jgi:pantetheine-phosphate adenylyltransferase